MGRLINQSVNRSVDRRTGLTWSATVRIVNRIDTYPDVDLLGVPPVIDAVQQQLRVCWWGGCVRRRSARGGSGSNEAHGPRRSSRTQYAPQAPVPCPSGCAAGWTLGCRRSPRGSPPHSRPPPCPRGRRPAMWMWMCVCVRASGSIDGGRIRIETAGTFQAVASRQARFGSNRAPPPIPPSRASVPGRSRRRRRGARAGTAS